MVTGFSQREEKGRARRPELGSAKEGEHNAHDDDDHGRPNEEVSSAHGGAGDAAESQQRRNQRDDDQDKRIVDKVFFRVYRASPGPDMHVRQQENGTRLAVFCSVRASLRNNEIEAPARTLGRPSSIHTTSLAFRIGAPRSEVSGG
jgi:hypothetical protein